MAALITTAILCAITSVGIYIFYVLTKHKNAPPGPWGVPILGYLPFINPERPQITLTNLAKKYGPIYSLSMGSVFTVVLSDHKLIREAFAKDAFSGRAPLYLTHGIMEGRGIICAEGPLWKDQRKLVTAWLREFGMTKHSANRQNLQVRIIKNIDAFIKELEPKCGQPEKILPILSHTLGNIINDIVFGYTFKPQDEAWKWMRAIQENSVEKMGVAGIVNFLPFMRFFSKSIRDIMKVILTGQAQTHRMYTSLVYYTRELLGEKKIVDDYKVKCYNYNFDKGELKSFIFDAKNVDKSDGACILNNYLKEQKKRIEKDEDDAKFMTDKQLMYLLADLFGAGLDTTAATLSWFYLLVAVHPNVQDTIRKEIYSVCGSRAPDLDDWEQLKFTQATISEVQRIRSVVPVGIPHGCKETTTLGGYTIPQKSMIVALQWAVHMDTEIWDEPEKFNPLRFLDEEGNLIKPPEFIPFQTGKRICPGDELARIVLFLHISRVLNSYRIRLQEDVKPTNLDGHVGLTLSPPPIPLIFESVGK